MFIIFIIVSFFQASRRVDFSANPLADLSFDFYDESLLQEVGLCFLFFFNIILLFIYSYHAPNANRSKRSETEINGSTLSFMKEGAEYKSKSLHVLMES